MHRVQPRLGLRRVLMMSFGAAAVRWVLIGNFPEYLSVLIAAQTLHAVTFGAYHAAAIELVHRFFTGRHQCRGQAIYGSVSFGLGGALGSLYSGLTWVSLGPAVTFEIAALCAAVAFVISALAIKPSA
jgi:PPP family 3-phenylpropionic acid transporter